MTWITRIILLTEQFKMIQIQKSAKSAQFVIQAIPSETHSRRGLLVGNDNTGSFESTIADFQVWIPVWVWTRV